jgi:hypothetical protein
MLIKAGYLKPVASGNELDRASHMAQAILFAVGAVVDPSQSELVFEWPQIYDARSPGKTKSDPNKIIPLAAVGGALAPAFCASRIVLPREWKGQTPKPKSKRSPYVITDRVKSRLLPSEMEVVAGLSNAEWDVWDAIGIGLWDCDRFTRRRVFPGATH